MHVSSLRAVCANCRAEEELSRIAEGDGSCPYCRLSFCDDDTRPGATDLAKLSGVPCTKPTPPRSTKWPLRTPSCSRPRRSRS